MVIEEMVALAERQRLRPDIHYWRTQAGAEVDLLIVEGQKILPVQIKLGAAVDPRSIQGLRNCMEDLGLKRGWVVTTGGERRQLSPRIEVIPWQQLIAGHVQLF